MWDLVKKIGQGTMPASNHDYLVRTAYEGPACPLHNPPQDSFSQCWGMCEGPSKHLDMVRNRMPTWGDGMEGRIYVRF